VTASREAAARIRFLNDHMRALGPSSSDSERWLFTSGVLALGSEAVAETICSIQTFSDFDPGNDPHGEHDFGSVPIGDRQIFWKIDYYDRSLTGGSPDPADASVTCRVLTVMLSSEY
jgi:hypothetical protein